jgi:hypothetical protein
MNTLIGRVLVEELTCLEDDPVLSLSSESGGVGNALSVVWEVMRRTFSKGAGGLTTGNWIIVSGVGGGVNSGVIIPDSLPVPWVLDSTVPEQESFAVPLPFHELSR